MRTLLVIFIMLLEYKASCQKGTDIDFTFKTTLFLEKANVSNSKGFEVKNFELLSFFNRYITLNLDTVKSYGFPVNYLFLRLATKSAISYDKAILKSDSSFLLFIEDGCSEYVLAINTFNGKSYRLKGFNANDFISLFTDIRLDFERSSSEKINIKKFLKNYKVDFVDFECIHKALKSGTYDKRLYSCLNGCEVKPTVIH